MTPIIPTRFLAGSTEPATAYTVEELRELLAELPDELSIVGGAELLVYTELEALSIRHVPDEPLADPDGDFELDDLDTRHETGGES